MKKSKLEVLASKLSNITEASLFGSQSANISKLESQSIYGGYSEEDQTLADFSCSNNACNNSGCATSDANFNTGCTNTSCTGTGNSGCNPSCPR